MAGKRSASRMTASNDDEREALRKHFAGRWIEDFCDCVSQAKNFWGNSEWWNTFAAQVKAFQRAWNRSCKSSENPLKDEVVLDAWSKVYESAKNYRTYKTKQKPLERSRNKVDKRKLQLTRIVHDVKKDFFRDDTLDEGEYDGLVDLHTETEWQLLPRLDMATSSWHNSDEFQTFREAADEYHLVIEQCLAGGDGDLNRAHKRLYDAAKAYLRYKLGRHVADEIIDDPKRLAKGSNGIAKQGDNWSASTSSKVDIAFRVLQGKFSPQAEDVTSFDDDTGTEVNEPIRLKFDDLSSSLENHSPSFTQEDSSEINNKVYEVSESDDFRHPQRSGPIKLKDVEKRGIPVGKPYQKPRPIRPNGGKGRRIPVSKPYRKPRARDLNKYNHL